MSSTCTPELADPLRLGARRPGHEPVVDVGLGHPLAHRVDPEAELGGDAGHRAEVGPPIPAHLAHEAHGLVSLRLRVPTRRLLASRFLSRRGSILTYEVGSLQRTQCGSA